MNCISCGAPLMPGAKFCTRCGAKQNVSSVSTQVNAESKAVQEESGQNMPFAQIKQKIYWNIQQGEVARQIKEAEFTKYDTALGVIVNDGTTAYIKANGVLLKELRGGTYDFMSSSELNQVLQTRVGGAPSWFKRSCRFVSNLIFGERVGDRVANPGDDLSKVKTFEQVLEYMKRGDLFSIALKQNREFLLVLGGDHATQDQCSDFYPMKVNTKYLDVDLGLKAYFQISDFPEFLEYYLADKDLVRTNDLCLEITPLVRSVIQDCMRDMEIKENIIPDDVKEKLEVRLKNLNLHGVSLKSIVELSVNSEDLERMRQFARELYLSEQELDILRRSNEFKNRMSTVVAEQQIHEARTELEIYNRLQDINKDKLLSEDELEKFYMILSREKRIREAQNEDQINAALADIEKTGLLRAQDIDIVRHQIKQGFYQRGQAIRLMQLRGEIEAEQVRAEGLHGLQMSQLLHELDLVRKQEEFKDEQFYKNLERSQAVVHAEMNAKREAYAVENEQAEFLYNLAERGQNAQMQRLKEMELLDADLEDRATERKLKEQQLQFDHEYRMQQDKELTERERLHVHQQMSAEQIMADEARLLDKDAQVAYANSFSAGKNAEREREFAAEQRALLERQLANQQQTGDKHADDMKEMMNNMMATMAQMSGNMVQNRNEQREEYREQLMREQRRHDQHQDRALNYTTRLPQSAQPQPAQQQTAPQQPAQQPAPQQQPAPKTAQTNYKMCTNPDCESHKRGDRYPVLEFICAYCGKELE